MFTIDVFYLTLIAFIPYIILILLLINIIIILRNVNVVLCIFMTAYYTYIYGT